ncbi:hypothetical protein F4806DRAFT_194247 [Annulohypoxylon nitens]|nr:hypothetical protein F4806DRAFT_194247 [Annulohypoxylon nitens]
MDNVWYCCSCSYGESSKPRPACPSCGRNSYIDCFVEIFLSNDAAGNGSIYPIWKTDVINTDKILQEPGYLFADEASRLENEELLILYDYLAATKKSSVTISGLFSGVEADIGTLSTSRNCSDVTINLSASTTADPRHQLSTRNLGRFLCSSRSSFSPSESSISSTVFQSSTAETPRGRDTGVCEFCSSITTRRGNKPLACPLYKLDPDRYFKCHSRKFETESHLQQHLNRCHKLRRCWVSFGDEGSNFKAQGIGFHREWDRSRKERDMTRIQRFDNVGPFPWSSL